MQIVSHVGKAEAGENANMGRFRKQTSAKGQKIRFWPQIGIGHQKLQCKSSRGVDLAVAHTSAFEA